MLYGLLNRGVSFNPETDIPDLSGKVIFLTGGRTPSLLFKATIVFMCPSQEMLASEKRQFYSYQSTVQSTSTSQHATRKKHELRYVIFNQLFPAREYPSSNVTLQV